MSTEQELPENIADAPEIEPPSAQEPAKKPKKVIGRPITKETAKQYQLSAAKAKRLRKEARAQMLQAMCTKLNLGDELVKAFLNNDDRRINIVEKALRIVGLTHDQSSDAIAQKISLDAKANVKKDSTVKLILEDLTKPEEE